MLFCSTLCDEKEFDCKTLIAKLKFSSVCRTLIMIGNIKEAINGKNQIFFIFKRLPAATFFLNKKALPAQRKTTLTHTACLSALA